jgi:hypothetical protein
MTLVIPSYFKADDLPDFADYIYNNTTLKMGQVIKINYPDPSKDKNAFITYNVMVNDQKGAEQYNVIYYDCLPSQLFGSAADFFEYTLRSNVSKDTQQEDVLTKGQIDAGTTAGTNKLLGSVVIIACLGGDSSSPIIIGSLPNFFLDKNKNYKFQEGSNGHFLNFMFNGVNVNINKDGELLIKKGGPTKADGTLSGKKEQANSFIQIDKEGKIILSTTNKAKLEEADNSVTINKDGSINIKIKDGKTLEIKDKDGDAKLTLGDGAKSVAIAEALEQLWNKLKQQGDIFDNHLHSSGVGPTGPPTPTLSIPSWNDAIVSKTMKLPK